MTAGGGELTLTVGAGGFTCMGAEAGGAAWTALGSIQFNAGLPRDGDGGEMVSSGIFGDVAQPAKKISRQKNIPIGLDTRPLCGTQKRTQAVLRSGPVYFD